MAQRIFRKDDTAPWRFGYGTGAEGAEDISSDTLDSARSGYANTPFTGSAGANTGSMGSFSGFSDGDLVLIVQIQGSGAGQPELNKIVSHSGTTPTFADNLIANYVSGAQIYRLAQHTTIKVDAAKTLTGVAWDGSKGGITVLFANQSIEIDGIIDVSQKGFRGGGSLNTGTGQVQQQGESYDGVGGQSSSQNAGAGGGGQNEQSAGYNNETGGGGAGYGSDGVDSAYNSGGHSGTTRGQHGSAYGDAALTLLHLGSAGGAGSYFYNATGYGGDGGRGGGLLILIAPRIFGTGTIKYQGGDMPDRFSIHSGGAGSGGGFLTKGNVIDFSAMTINGLGGLGSLDSTDGIVGTAAGGDGRGHVDYGTKYTAPTSPATPLLDYRLDSILAPKGGAAAIQI